MNIVWATKVPNYVIFLLNMNSYDFLNQLLC